MKKTISRFILSTVFIGGIFAAPAVYAQCAGPVSIEGGIDYDATNDQLLVCDGTNWIVVGPGGTISPDSIDWDDITDTMTLDATTTIDMTAGDLNFDSDTFVIDSSANEIGIGTNDPGAKLHLSHGIDTRLEHLITNTSTGTNVLSRTYHRNTGFQGTYIGVTGANYTGGWLGQGGNEGFVVSSANQFNIINAHTNAPMVFMAGSNTTPSEIMRLTYDARLGIGTGGNPDANAALEVAGTDLGFLPPRNTDPATNITGTAGLIAYDSTDNELQFFDGTSWVAVATGAGVTPDSLDWDDFTDTMTLDATTTINMDTNTADLNFDSNTFVIDSSENDIGIGTAAPTGFNASSNDTVLHINNGNSNGSSELVLASGTNSVTGVGLLSFALNDGTQTGSIRSQKTGTGLTSSFLSFGTHDGTSLAERMRIAATGELGVGTTTPTTDIHVFDDTGVAAIAVEGNEDSISGLALHTSGDGATLLGSGAGSTGWLWEAKGDIWATADEREDIFLTYWNGTTWDEWMFISHDTGHIGLGGDIDPDVLLDMPGTIKLGDGGESCDAAREGSIRYDGAGDTFYFCSTAASGWEAVSLGSGVNAINDLSDAATPAGNNVFLGHTATNILGGANTNVAVGIDALVNITSGYSNAVLGYGAGQAITTGYSNTAIGTSAYYSGNGNFNAIVGHDSMSQATTASYNTTLGAYTLYNNTIGTNNTAIGYGAAGGAATTSGDMDGNTVVGYYAGYAMEGGASGAGANNNLLFGYQAGDVITTGDNNIVIGYDVDPSSATASNELNIGNTLFGDLANNYIGIGNNAPDVLLHIGPANITSEGGAHEIILSDVAGQPNILFIDQGNDETSMGITSDDFFAIATEDTQSGIQFKVNADYTTDMLNTGTVAMTIQTDGDVAIGSSAPNANAVLDINGGTNKGFLPPRNADPATNITGTAGLIAYDSTDNELQFFNGSAWVAVATGSGGASAINDLSDGASDGSSVFLGSGSGANDDGTTNENIGLGINAMNATTSGNRNVAIGRNSLASNTVGGNIIAIGHDAMENYTDTTSGYLIAIGNRAGRNHSSGWRNIAIGHDALMEHVNGNDNIGIGYTALTNVDGQDNIGIGSYSGDFAGWRNTMIGHEAGQGTSAAGTADGNVMLGYRAGTITEDADNNTLIGFQAGDVLTTGDNNIIIGYDVDPSSATASNEMNIGNTIFGDLANNRVGIGITSPVGALHIDTPSGGLGTDMSAITTTGAALHITEASNDVYLDANTLANTGSNFHISNSDAYDLIFYTDATERMRITELGQMGIGTATPDSNALLDLSSSSLGFLPPRNADPDGNITGVAGLIAYDSTDNELQYFDGSAWVSVGGGGGGGLWTDLTGGRIHYGTSAANQVGVGTNNPGYTLDVNGDINLPVGNTIRAGGNEMLRMIAPNDASGVHAVVIGTNSAHTNLGAGTGFNQWEGPGVYIGHNAGNSIDSTSGGSQAHVFIGVGAGQNVTTNTHNTFIGAGAGSGSNVSFGATVVGAYAGQNAGQSGVYIGRDAGGNGSLTMGNDNTVVGTAAGSDAVGNYNSFIGMQAGREQRGASNTALGYQALHGVDTTSTANDNIAIGYRAMDAVTTSNNNIAIGSNAAGSLVDGTGANVFIGHSAGSGVNTTDAYQTVAVGAYAGSAAALGYNNSFFGERAGRDTTGNFNTFIGRSAGQNVVAGSENIVLGAQSESAIFAAGDNNILIGYEVDTPAATSNNYLNIGNLIYGDLANSEVFLDAPAAAPADADLANGQITFWVDATNDEIELKARDSAGDIINVTVGAGGGGGGGAINDLTDGLTTAREGLYLGETFATAPSGRFNTVTGISAGQSLSTTEPPGTWEEGGYNTFYGHAAGLSTTTGYRNVFMGVEAGRQNTTGDDNTFIGNAAGYNNTADGGTFIGHAAGISNTIGVRNVFIGENAGYENIDGNENTAVGTEALNTNTTGDFNTAVGYRALYESTGSSNVAMGWGSLRYATTANDNTSIGEASMNRTTTGGENTALGYEALYWNQTGTRNTALGVRALQDNTAGSNIAIGYEALLENTSGSGNLAIGNNALDAVTTTGSNLAVGNNALSSIATGYENTALGVDAGQSLATNSYQNVLIGASAGHSMTQGYHNIGIGYGAGYQGLGFGSVAIGNGAIGSYSAAWGTTQVNVGIGLQSLSILTDGTGNVAVGGSTGGDFGVSARNGEMNHNTLIGYRAGNSLDASSTSPEYNTFLGSQAGSNVTTGSSNILIGYGVSASSATVSNELNIGGLIHGDIGSSEVFIDAPASAPADGDLANGQVTFWVDAASDEIELKARDSAGDIINVTVGSGGGGGGATDLDGLSDAYTDYTTDNNVAIGQNAGGSIASGATFNTLIGQRAGEDLTTGDESVAIGYNAMGSATVQGYSVAIGYNAAQGWTASSEFNSLIAIGNSAAGEQSDGFENIAIGNTAMNLGGGNRNTVVGGSAGFNGIGDENTLLGHQAMNQAAGDHNVMIGQSAGRGQASASVSRNVIIGQDASTGINTGANDNIVIGYNAADGLTTGSGNIIIGSSTNGVDISSSTASRELNIGGTIFGDLANTLVGIGQLPASGVELDVLGDIEYTGTITDVSDRRLKDNIESLNKRGSLIEKINAIDTYSFTMKDDEDGKTEFGVIAQEIEEIFPELVRTSDDEMGTKSVNYVGLIAPMIEATKELSAENAALKAELSEIKEDIAGMKIHTGYDMNKANAQNLMMMLIMMVFGGGCVWVVTRLQRKA